MDKKPNSQTEEQQESAPIRERKLRIEELEARLAPSGKADLVNG